MRKRIYQIRELRDAGTPVRIEGDICHSTCTMFIGLPQTCVHPETVFGFHGPSSWGKPLQPDVFETASRLISEHYPATIADWYMREARHSLWLSRVRGSELIRHGVSECGRLD